jgi:hypothetical protein
MADQGDKFGQEWKSALEGAEAHFPGGVWDNLHLPLANADLQKYRRRSMIFGRAAVIAVLVAVVSLMPFSRKSEMKGDSPILMNNTALGNEGNNSGMDQFIATINHIWEGKDEHGEQIIHQQESQRYVAAESSKSKQAFSGRSLIPTLQVSNKKDEFISLHEVTADEVSYDIEPRQGFYQLSNQKKSERKNRYWAGLGFGSSTFNPNFQQTGNGEIATAILSARNPNFVNTSTTNESPASVDQQMTSGINNQLAMTFGMKLTDRWTLESGMMYSRAQLGSSTNIILDNSEFTRSVPLTGDSEGIPSVEKLAQVEEIVEYSEEQVEMNNTFQFAAVPIRAGYILVDSRFNMRLNAGVVTNFYLGNRLTNDDSDLETISIQPGDNSPYRSINLSGSTGLTFGYSILKNLDVMVEPNYTHSLQPFTKNSSSFNTTPNSFGVMAGLRFNIK